MKIVDQSYNCQMLGQSAGIWQLRCRLRIFQTYADVRTVIISDTGFEMGWFIPYLVERLIDQVVHEFHLDPTRLIWLEHYESGEATPICTDCCQVMFDWHDHHAKTPTWKAIAPEIVSLLTGEELVAV